jgi:NB-ARC domain/TIR domain
MTKIFLSYVRADEETAPFASRLRDELVARGFDVWFDLTSMPSRSLTFMQEIRDAIRARDRLVVILGPAAAHSEYVRAEWQAALIDEKVVVPIMRTGSFADLPDELRYLPAFDGSDRRPFHDVVAELERVLIEPVPPLSPLKGAVPDQPPHFRPRPDDMTRLASALFSDVQRPVVVSGPERVHVLHGMAGSGKSVLAAAFARSTAARRVFVDGVIWAGASPDHSSLDVLRTLLGVLGAPILQLTTVPEAVSLLRRTLAAGRTLVVLDNMWKLEQVEPVMQAIPQSSRVLVTTQHADLGTALGANIQRLEGLGDEAALQYLADWIGTAVEKLPSEAVGLAEYCGNLPLALALQGALAREGVPWNDLLEALRAADVGYADHLLTDYPYRSVFQALDVSIEFLERSDPAAAARFRELAAFLWKGSVPEPAIVRFWQHRAGLPERYGRRLLTLLEQRALLRLDASSSPRHVRLHDLMAAVLAAKTNRTALNDELLDWYRSQCNGIWSEVPPDGYVHAHLVEHLELALADQEIEALLLAEDADGRNSWFVAQNRHGTNVAYMADVHRARAHVSVRVREELDRTGQSTAVADELRYALICASVNTVSTGLTPPLLSIVAREEGWTRARTLEEARAIAVPEGRVEALAALAEGLWGEQLDGVVADALAAVRNIRDPYWRGGALARLLRALGGRITAGDVERVVDGIDEPTQRAALEALVAHLRSGGTLSQFGATADAADSGFRDPRGLVAQLATFSPYTNEASTLRHRYVGDTVEDERALLAQAASIADPRTRSLVLASLSGELHGEAAAAACAAAIAGARSIGDRQTAVALRNDLIALVAARGGQSEALEIALASEHAQSRLASLIGLAPHLTGDVAAYARQKALAEFLSAPDQFDRVALAGDLAAWLAGAGELEGVRSIAAAAMNSTQRRRTLARVALKSSQAEDLLWAELNSLEGSLWPDAVAETADVLSADHCREAVARAARLTTVSDRDIVLAALAARLSVVGAGTEARALLPSIEDDVWRELAAVEIARTLAEHGDGRGAIEIAASVRQAAWRIRAIAPALPLLQPSDRARVVDELLAFVEAIGDMQSSGHLNCLLLPMAETATAERIAAQVTARMAQVTDGAALACDLAIALARAGKADEALGCAIAIAEPNWRAEALTRVAPLLDSPISAARIIENAGTLSRIEARVAVLTGVARPIAATTPLARYRIWDEVLRLLAGTTRREIAEYRSWLTAALGDLATDAGIKETLIATEKVFRWWP